MTAKDIVVRSEPESQETKETQMKKKQKRVFIHVEHI